MTPYSHCEWVKGIFTTAHHNSDVNNWYITKLTHMRCTEYQLQLLGSWLLANTNLSRCSLLQVARVVIHSFNMKEQLCLKLHMCVSSEQLNSGHGYVWLVHLKLTQGTFPRLCQEPLCTTCYFSPNTNFMKLSPSWEAASCAAIQKFPVFYGTKVSLPFSRSYPETDQSSPFYLSKIHFNIIYSPMSWSF
jgi:hypothetical protein